MEQINIQGEGHKPAKESPRLKIRGADQPKGHTCKNAQLLQQRIFCQCRYQHQYPVGHGQRPLSLDAVQMQVQLYHAGPQSEKADGLGGQGQIPGFGQQIQDRNGHGRQLGGLFCQPANDWCHQVHDEQVPQKPQMVHHGTPGPGTKIAVQPLPQAPIQDPLLGKESRRGRDGLAEDVKKDPQGVEQQIGHRQSAALLLHIVLPGKGLPEQQHPGDQKKSRHCAAGDHLRAQKFQHLQPPGCLKGHGASGHIDPILAGMDKHHHKCKPELGQIQPLGGSGGYDIGILHTRSFSLPPGKNC